MTVPEKLRLREALWTDLSRHEENIELPARPGQVLRKTEQRVPAGKETALDWEKAKGELREQFS